MARSESIRLRCANHTFGVVRGTGELRVHCPATRCRTDEGIRVHVFNLEDGTYVNDVEPFRDPLELRGYPGVREIKHASGNR